MAKADARCPNENNRHAVVGFAVIMTSASGARFCRYPASPISRRANLRDIDYAQMLAAIVISVNYARASRKAPRQYYLLILLR